MSDQPSISVFYTTTSKKDLKNLDHSIAKRIVHTIHRYTRSNPLLHAKSLSGILYGRYRYRIGNYRVIFYLDKSGIITIVTILTIKHRKDVYK